MEYESLNTLFPNKIKNILHSAFLSLLMKNLIMCLI